MPLTQRPDPPLQRFPRSYRRIATIVGVGVFACRAGDQTALPGAVELRTVTIDSVTQLQLERGTRDTLTATTIDHAGNKVSVPVVWRSSKESVAIFERGGTLVAQDTGFASIVATSLGVTSAPVAVRVVWLGPAKISAGSWSRKNAVSAGAVVTDSLRVVVTNIHGAPVPNASVKFTVTEGGGSVSPSTATTSAGGIAAAQWTLGPALGRNAVSAAAVRSDGSPNPLVTDNAVQFTLTSYNALSIQSGNGQTGQVVSDLPVAPSVRLVDSLGAPRPGLPVVFTAFSNGRVVTPVVSTDANGLASPGTWTLGDIPGEQTLEAKVEDARIVFRATATGSPIHYKPSSVTAGGFATCALESNAVKCWGQTPQNGGGDSTSVSAPRAVKNSLVAASLTGGATHFCAVTFSGEAWCWGRNALVDTSGLTVNANVPTRLPSDIVWARVSAGPAHNCGITGAQVAYCWGDNSAGQLGDQTLTPRRAPTPVAGGFKFSQISSGTNHSCGLSLDGSAFCWGANGLGQIGDGTTVTRTGPTVVTGGQTYQQVGAGEGFSCALSTQGQAFCWGALNGAQIVPTTYTTAPTFVSLSVGGAHACALTADGSAYCWGNNAWGQLGDSTTTTRNAPTRVAGAARFTQLSAGYMHTCARATDGTVACWGRNTAGELGESGAGFRSAPHFVVIGVNP